MTSRQRIQAVLAGETPDRTPIFPKIAFSNTLACPDMTVLDYMTDPACMAKACIEAYRRFGWDGVSLHTDIGSEGMALGSVYQRPVSGPAELQKPLLATADEYQRIDIPDPLSTEPMKTVIQAVRLVKEQIGDEAYILAWTNGPLNVASQVLALDELLMTLLDEPETVHLLLERCTQVAITYARELIHAGADAIAFGHATASNNVISRSHYEEFALPYEKNLIAAIHQLGAKAVTHICGDIVPTVDLIAQNGSDIIDFDHVCDIKILRQKAPGKVFRGNIDPALLAMRTPDQIRAAVRELLKDVGKDPRFLLGSGCEIGLNTPLENLHAFVDAGKGYTG